MESYVPEGSSVSTLEHIPSCVNGLVDCCQSGPRTISHIIRSLNSGMKNLFANISPLYIGEESDSADRNSQTASGIKAKEAIRVIGSIESIGKSIKCGRNIRVGQCITELGEFTIAETGNFFKGES